MAAAPAHPAVRAAELFRAVVALIFAAVTIFWQEPHLGAATWVMGLFLVGTGLSAISPSGSLRSFSSARVSRMDGTDCFRIGSLGSRGLIKDA